MQTLLLSWQSLIAAVGGALLTILGVWLTNKSNFKQLKLRLEHDEEQLKLRLEQEQKLHKQRLSKERLEELYGLVNDWSNAIFLNCHALQLLARGEITLEKYREHLNAPDMPKCDLGRLEMIAGIYGGELQAVFNSAIDIKDKISMVDTAIFNSIGQKKSCKDLLTPLTAFQSEYMVSIVAFKKEIIKVAKEV